MKLYTVTTIVEGWPSEESKKYGGLRTVVVCTSLERAKEIVENNEFDIFETSYTYAVIALIEADELYGGFNEREEEVWYKWEGDGETGKYLPSAKPEEYKNVRFGL